MLNKNKKKIKVNSKLSSKIKKLNLQKENKRIIKNVLTLKRFVKPTLVEGKNVLSEEQINAGIILEVFTKSIQKYADIWKKITETLKNSPDSAEEIYKNLTSGNLSVNEDQAIEELESFAASIKSLIEQAKKIKAQIEDSDEKISNFVSDNVSGSDLTGEDISSAMDDEDEGVSDKDEIEIEEDESEEGSEDDEEL